MVWRMRSKGEVAIPKWQLCPKCRGMLNLNSDTYGWYIECLMCGYVYDLEDEVVRPQGSQGKTGQRSL
jgi:DNA-directed RNA polymerase subunit M/transcription elongation factor TFIIS